MGFPDVINSPAGHVAIRFGLTGLNTTISAGTVSSLQAIAYAADFIADGRAEVLLAGGVEELSAMSYSGFCAARLLAGSDGKSLRCAAPLDVDRSGFSVGEGAVVFVMESPEHAVRRGAAILAEISGFGTTFLAPSAGAGRQSAAAAHAMRAALAEASVDRASVGSICAGANGSRIGDDTRGHRRSPRYSARGPPRSRFIRSSRWLARRSGLLARSRWRPAFSRFTRMSFQPRSTFEKPTRAGGWPESHGRRPVPRSSSRWSTRSAPTGSTPRSCSGVRRSLQGRVPGRDSL